MKAILLGMLASGLAFTQCAWPWSDNGTPCTAMFVYGITAHVTNSQTGSAIANATLTLKDGSYTEIMEPFPSGGYIGAGERAGTYSLTAVATGYQTYNQTNIVVTVDPCHVIPVVLNIKMVPQ